jgi:NADPH:quinone reductase-like Zn-dependent oxidoreductase
MNAHTTADIICPFNETLVADKIKEMTEEEHVPCVYRTTGEEEELGGKMILKRNLKE